MKTLNVPAELQKPPHSYPSHSTMGIEDAFLAYAGEHDIRTDWVYLPILWTNNYCHDRQQHGPGFRALDEVQKFLDENLREDEQYFTVVQCDDGIYEDLPPNVFVFGAGGVGDEPIPLLCEPHPKGNGKHDKYLASFMGALESGGPVQGKRKESSWDPNTGGGPIRQAMLKELAGKKDTLIAAAVSTRAYRWLMENSTCALCPRGYGKTSFRLYEAMGLGCVPVYIYDEPWLPYRSELDWRKLAVLCHVDQIPGLYQGLQIARHSAAKRLKHIQAVYDDYFTLEGASRQIARMVEERSR